MHKKVKAVRDINLIEDALKNAVAGFLIIQSDEEILARYATTFIYSDKNIFIPIENDDDILDKTEQDKNAVFTVIRNDEKEKGKETKPKMYYKFLSIKLEGIIKKADDLKLLTEINNSYSEKYYREKHENGKLKFYILDTEEFQAVEETGV